MKVIGDSSQGKPTEIDAQKADAAKSNAERPDATSPEDADAKNREITAALSKEAGYKSVVYRGRGKFDVDYAISGSVSHSFLLTFNADAQAVLPFVMVEVRLGGAARVRAPGFSGDKDSGGAISGLGGMGGGASEASKYLDGAFVLDTDAEIVSQNNEDGVKTVGKRKQIAWRVTSLTKDAPMAVLRLKN